MLIRRSAAPRQAAFRPSLRARGSSRRPALVKPSRPRRVSSGPARRRSAAGRRGAPQRSLSLEPDRMNQGATYEPLSAASEFVSATAQDACLEALDHGARRLVVEISDLTSLSLDSMQLL